MGLWKTRPRARGTGSTRPQWVPMVMPRKLAHLNKRFINRFMVRIAPYVPGLAVLHHRGRRSGRRFSIPINVFVRGERYVFALTYGSDTDWLRNVLAAGRCTITTRGRVVPLHSPRVYRDEQRAQMRPVVRWVLGLIGVTEFVELWTPAAQPSPRRPTA